MTPEELNQIDKELAEKLMEWHLGPHPFYQSNAWLKKDNSLAMWGGWSPTHNIAHARQVIEEMLKRGYRIELHLYPDNKENELTFLNITKGNDSIGKQHDFSISELEEALSLAALKALRAQEGE